MLRFLAVHIMRLHGWLAKTSDNEKLIFYFTLPFSVQYGQRNCNSRRSETVGFLSFI
jgi:hypothetical protein